MPPASSVRTTSATSATSSFRPCTASTNFFGNLYHLNTQEEPENPDYPKNPEFRAKFGPRGVLKCKATDRDYRRRIRASAASASRPSRTPVCSTRKRMETVDEEFLNSSLDFIDRQHGFRRIAN